MEIFKAHFIGDNAIWRGVGWYQPFFYKQNGVPINLATWAVPVITVHQYAEGPLVAGLTIVPTIADAPSGNVLLTCVAANSTGAATGKYIYRLVLAPAGGTEGVAKQPIIVYGELQVRDV